MDRDDSPRTLDAELLEEGGGNDGVRGREGVGIEERAADHADEDDGESPTEYLRAVADHSSASHSAKVCDDLGYGYGIGAEIVLVLQHGRVQILGAVGLDLVILYQ